MPSHTTAPDADYIAAMAERALASIPSALRRHASGIAFAVEDFADADTLAEMGLESEWDLSGLYRGTPLHLRSTSDVARPPDMIQIYRLPLLLEWVETGEDLYRLVRSVLIHEVAHHFGFSDDEIEALEAAEQ